MRSQHPFKLIFVLAALGLWLCLGQSCAPATMPCDENRPCPASQECKEGFCVCPEAMARCGETCVDLRSNPGHCGTCDSKCNDGWRCLQGTCACDSGKRACGDQCVQLASNAQHCGRCGNACPKGERCQGGQCTKDCPLDTTTCGNACANLNRDPAHCGKCDKQCNKTEICNQGTCACPPGWLRCQGKCIDPMSQPSHCGKCGNQCAQSQLCASGRCQGECPKSTPTICFGACFDTKSNRNHCGSCGNACRPDQRCHDGRCACPPSTVACNGRCVHLYTSYEHCGACGHSCREGQVCHQGQCRRECPSSSPKNCFGGCFDTQTNPLHCGQCDLRCAPGEACVAGKCVCPKGRVLCHGKCIDPSSDPIHCGKCDSACKSYQQCSKGACVPSCPKDTIACYGGCHNASSSAAHCGTCGNACQGGTTCQTTGDKGRCQCPNGLKLCQGACVDTQSDRLNCGKCGALCGRGQDCQNGQCVLSCGDLSACGNLCVDHSTDPAHCGSCNNACPNGQTCSGGTCTCPQGRSLCGGTCVDTQTDRNNCGGCGQQCKTSEICQQGKCQVLCPDPSLQACGSLCVDPQTDPAHCGGCSKQCGQTQFCTAGSCACRQGQTACGSNCIDLQIDPSHCGKCGNQCATGQFCNEGTCQRCSAAAPKTCGTTCCRSNQDCCGNTCVDHNSSVDHCGKCGNQCAASQICLSGKCTCKPGQTRACYTGPANTRNKGVCKDGTQTCNAGTWSLCNNERKPTAEICDGLDNDCDGSIDELFPTKGKACSAGRGACRRTGRINCTADGKGVACSAKAAAPQKESCDGKDNDCDGSVDEALLRNCYTGPKGTAGQGICKEGKQSCSAGKWGTCAGQVLPKKEICDGIDNDCDGTPDNGCSCTNGDTRACGSSTGACKKGTQTCAGGQWEKCVGQIKPKAEICDGIDNDCDGKTDEELTPPPCAKQKGICRGATKRCAASGGKVQWLNCTTTDYRTHNASYQTRETRCDNRDNDCDGNTDESISRACYTGPAATRNKGICKDGTQTCSAGSWGLCVGQVKPQTETCDGKDNDCDGSIDESISRACYTGPAGTAGKGICKAGTQTCRSGSWGTCSGQTLPGKETCDGKDNDCDGSIDESLTQSCYTGPAGTAGKGICKKGTQTCSRGSWGTCAGQVTPKTETCDRIDNDCDGIVDEGCNCTNGTRQNCGSSVGECTQGTQLCTGGQWGTCTGGQGPTAETCDGKDNDCDGSVDESLTQSCYTGPTGTSGKGECKKGTQTCRSGSWGTCVGQITPKAETCDGKDNDCDGSIDEGLSKICYTGPKGSAGVGICQAGRQTCRSGSWGSCIGEVTPKKETCDNKDNDCDGSIDEGLTQSCYTGPAGTSGVGRCKAGTQTCRSGSWGSCIGQVIPRKESCDGTDDDCDGKIDEGCNCTNGDIQNCGSSVGECTQGRQTCNNGQWGTCTGGQGPTAEQCDGKDNDCDGSVDESLTQSCYTGPSGTLGVGECKAGTQTCRSGSWGTCVGQIVPATEACDGKDNDCDGTVDEKLTRPCYTGPKGTLGVGTCKAGVQTCRSGSWGTCSGQVTPQQEVCDGKDNDCDGKIDEDLSGGGDGGKGDDGKPCNPPR